MSLFIPVHDRHPVCVWTTTTTRQHRCCCCRSTTRIPVRFRGKERNVIHALTLSVPPMPDDERRPSQQNQPTHDDYTLEEICPAISSSKRRAGKSSLLCLFHKFLATHTAGAAIPIPISPSPCVCNFGLSCRLQATQPTNPSLSPQNRKNLVFSPP